MKKIISLFLAVLMTVSLPFCAYAEETETEEPIAETYTITFVYADKKVDTQTVKKDKKPTVPETNTAANYDETNHYTYSWPDVEAATADKTYNEKRTEEAHRYDEPTVEKEATCTEAGVNISTCTVCGYVHNETISAKGHDYPDEWTVDPEVPGQKVKECRNGCGTTSKEKTTITTPATCDAAGKQEVTTFEGDEVIETREEEIPATGHRFTQESVSTEDGDPYDLYTCEVCGQTCKYFTGHDWDEGTVAKEPSCTETGITVYKCSKCDATRWETIPANGHSFTDYKSDGNATCTEDGTKTAQCDHCNATDTIPDEGSAGHEWSATSAACLRCKTNDSVVSFTVASCDKTQYYVGDKWNSTLKLNVEFANHPAVITTKENLLENFSTASAGTVKYSVKYEGQLLKNALQITVVKPKLTVKTASGETAYNDYSYVLGDKGVKFKVQSNTGDKIQYAKGNHLSVSLSNGVYTVKPSKYFTINAKNYKNYYVTFYFNRNGHAYSTKLYFSCGITRLKCNTAASVYTQGASVSKTLSFTQTYIDGTTAKRSVKKSLPTSSVGKKSVSYSYYGQKASYTYYVKCKTPSLKVSAKSKAVSLSWNRISGATGYKIYRATSKNGKYTAVKTISKGSTTSYKNTGLKSKKTYYYKIVAVYSKNSKCNSSYSSAKGCKTK